MICTTLARALRTKGPSAFALSALLAIAQLVWGTSLTQAATDPIAKVTAGELSGQLLPGGGASFKGVPFARPPVGNLRWRDPTPVKPWSGTRDAKAYGSVCIQPHTNDFYRDLGKGGTEDCLYLNVWTPEWPVKSPRPVIVWLHGGGHKVGEGSFEGYDGTALSERGLVVVTINYRLGVFGFFAHPGLTAESLHHSSGNYGLLDQLAALKWVRENIAQFGGDPHNVTLFGQSSGSVDVSILVASPLSKGLIDKAIQESGPPVRPIDSLSQDQEAGVKFGEMLKAPSDPSAAVKFLRLLSAADLEKTSETKLGVSDLPVPLLMPLVDGYLIPKYPALSYLDGQALPIPMIIGNNVRETTHSYEPAKMRTWIEDNFGPLAAQADQFYGLADGGTGNDDPLFGSASTQIRADVRDRCGAIAQGVWRNADHYSTYEYMWDVPLPGESFTRHAAEIPFVFGNLSANGTSGGSATESDKKISHQIQTYWVNFANTGNPNGEGLPEWPKFNSATRPYLEFTVHDGPVVHENLRRKICDLYIEALKETIPSDKVGDWPQ